MSVCKKTSNEFMYKPAATNCEMTDLFKSKTRWYVTFDLVFIVLWPVQVHGSGIPVQRIDGVGVGKQLREERLKDVGEVWRTWRERLVRAENKKDAAKNVCSYMISH